VRERSNLLTAMPLAKCCSSIFFKLPYVYVAIANACCLYSTKCVQVNLAILYLLFSLSEGAGSIDIAQFSLCIQACFEWRDRVCLGCVCQLYADGTDKREPVMVVCRVC